MIDVLRYINENLHMRLTLEGTARLFGYSKWHFCDCFRQYTGSTFVSYVRHRRMQLASLDVLRGRKIADIAQEYGYETQSGFNKSFLAEFGCLPTEFKADVNRYRRRYEERRTNMLQLSDRCESLRNRAVNEKPMNPLVCGQRAFHYLKGLYDVPAAARGNAMLRAAGLASVIRGAPPLICDGELIVGYNYGDAGCEGLSADEGEARAQLRQGGFSDGEIDWYFSRLDEAYGFFRRAEPAAPLGRQDAEMDAEMASLGYCLADNHTVLAYRKVLELGFEGLEREVEKHGEGREGDFYASMAFVCRAACELGDGYAGHAEALASACGDEARQRELRAIAETCRQVPRRPARSFREAVQSLWFAHIVNTWEDGINANSLGRLDQILYPYYDADIRNGVLTKAEAFELLCCLWIKLYRDYDVQQSCVGGSGADGAPEINALSWLMLDVTEALGFVRCLSVRFSQHTDRAFVMRALEVLGHVQKGVPFFFNDGVMIPALIRQGIEPADAADYTQIGCVETVIPGKANPHAVTGRCNLLKAMEYALGNGRSLYSPGLRPGLATGDPLSFKAFERLKDAVFEQVGHIVESACRKIARAVPPAAINDPKPFKSLLTEGCMESGLDFNARGAKYDYYQVMLLGIPNLADSLAAVRELVYARRAYAMGDLLYQIENDFPDEAVRLDFVNRAPKFGNDIDEADALAVEIVHHACDCLDAMSEKTGLRFHAQPFTFLWMVDHGALTAASPDGRRRGEILAYSASPMQGRDFNGFTALMNSLSKLPTVRTAGTTSAIVEVDPTLFTDRNIPRFADILLSAAGRGLSNVQFNVVDADTLLDAQRHPERHRNLAVRVSGFSQKFCLLDRTIQDHIIQRTKHRAL